MHLQTAKYSQQQQQHILYSSHNSANTNCLFTAFVKIENIETYFIPSNGWIYIVKNKNYHRWRRQKMFKLRRITNKIWWWDTKRKKKRERGGGDRKSNKQEPNWILFDFWFYSKQIFDSRFVSHSVFIYQCHRWNFAHYNYLRSHVYQIRKNRICSPW